MVTVHVAVGEHEVQPMDTDPGLPQGNRVQLVDVAEDRAPPAPRVRRGSAGNAIVLLSCEEERAARITAEQAALSAQARCLDLEARVRSLELKLAKCLNNDGLNNDDPDDRAAQGTSQTPDRVHNLCLPS